MGSTWKIKKFGDKCLVFFSWLEVLKLKEKGRIFNISFKFLSDSLKNDRKLSVIKEVKICLGIKMGD